ncbi:hypothetical protein CVH10_00275 [Halomonas sp. ND22Bw]|uniref:sulfotransferase family protein n=1 Tax=Halomonas sp. ND22Bw TaxID=2054178 RepID=UPI000D0B2F5F|nr:hypothetical protein CVH10_00275 [Halomonas sp. ND22Bw]
MNQQHLFIVGAPKCGTTALASYLSEHPDIFISNPKEPLFYLDERDPNRKIKDERHYQSLFKNAETEKVVGEASVWYLYSNTALRRIKEEYPSAKIVIMVREPVGFVASLHAQQYFGGWEKEKDLRKAWVRERAKFESLDFGKIETLDSLPEWRLLYPELMNHHKYVIKYKRAFGEGQVLVVDQSELKRDVRSVYEDVLEFLGVESDDREKFSVINSNKSPRSLFFRDFLLWLNRQYWLVNIARVIKSTFGINSLGLYKKLRALNLSEESRPPVPDALAMEIRRYIESLRCK